MHDYTTTPGAVGLPPCNSLVAQEWEQVIRILPADLEETAQAEQALRRRREVRSAQDLLRLVLAYALCDWSLRLVGAWATVMGMGSLSAVAVRKRLQRARKWLGTLVVTYLFLVHLALARPDVQLRIVDATAISCPGSPGSDWRVHLSFNLAELRLDAVAITDVHGGESLARIVPQPGEILLGDCGYARRTGLCSALEEGSLFVVRTGWRQLPLRDANGATLDLICWLRRVPPSCAMAQRAVWLKASAAKDPLRLIACRLPPQAAEAARRRIRRRASKMGRQTKRGTLEAAAFFLVVTNLPEDLWNTEDVLALYRIRWQVEMAIKRLKGIWQLDHLRAQDPDLAQTYFLGKLLGALLADDLSGKARVGQSPWFEDLVRPVSLWRLQCVWSVWLRCAIVGSISLEALLAALPRLQRYLRDSPRKKRGQKLAHALDWLRKLTGTANEGGSLMVLASTAHEAALS
jgi:hypothetical protein